MPDGWLSTSIAWPRLLCWCLLMNL
jgi:hypothetical protein